MSAASNPILPTNNKEFIDLSQITYESVTKEEHDKNGNVVLEFSPTKATDTLIEILRLKINADNSKIHWFTGEIYHSEGPSIIKHILYKIMGDDVHPNNVKEVIDRVDGILRLYPVKFNPHSHLLGVDNGVIDCRDGLIRDYSAEDLITDKIPIIYNPNAKCPNILKFIEDITSNYDDRITLLDMIASGAFREPLYYIAFLIGHGASGSSTFCQLIDKFYGEQNSSGSGLQDLLRDPFALSDLVERRYLIGKEVDAVKSAGTSILKAISGGDRISVNAKFKDRVNLTLFTKLVFTGNAIPSFEDATYGFERRFAPVNLPYKFKDNPQDRTNEKQKDPYILDKMSTEEELSGLLNVIMARLPWIISNKAIYRRERKPGDHNEQSNSVESFLDKFCEFSESSDDKTEIGELYEKFEKWANLKVANLVDKRVFGKVVVNFCNGRKGERTTEDKKHVTYYCGLFFKVNACSAEIAELENHIKIASNPNKITSTQSQSIPEITSITLNSIIEENKVVSSEELWKEICQLFGNNRTEDIDAIDATIDSNSNDSDATDMRFPCDSDVVEEARA